MSLGLLVKNGSQIVVEVVRALPDLIHVSYHNGNKSFQGILLDSNKGSLPCGNYPQGKVSSSLDEPAESHLYAVQQRFSYFTQEAKNINKKGHYSPLIAPKGMRTTCRLRPRQVLCSTCRAVCNEKKENVLAKSSRAIPDKDFKKIVKPNLESKLPNFDDPEKRKSLDKIVERCRLKRKSEIDMKVSLVPKLKKLKQSEINRCRLAPVSLGSSESLKKNNDNQTNKENRIDALAKKCPTVKKSANVRKTRSSIRAEKPKFHSLDMKKRRDPIELSESNSPPLLDDSSVKFSSSEVNSTPTIPKLTIPSHNINEVNLNKSIPSSVEKTESLHTPTLKICINPDGIGRVLNGTVSTTKRLFEGADTIDYNTKVSSSNKAVKLAIRRVRKTHKRAFCSVLGGKSPRLNGLSPKKFGSGMSPRHSRYMSPSKSAVCSPLRLAVLDNNLSTSSANTDLPDEVGKKHKRKGKHKKKHKNDKKSKLSIDVNHGKADKIDSLNSSQLNTVNNNLTIRRKSKENEPNSSENDSLLPKPKLSLSIKRLNSNGNQYVACENISPCDSESSGKSPNKSKITNKIRINLKEKECIVDSEGYPPVPIARKRNSSKDHSSDISLKLKVKEVKECLMNACTDASEVLQREMIEEWVFQIGDIVWAKSGGLHWLPGKIISLRVLEDCQAAGSSKETVPPKFVRGHKAKISWFDHSRDSSMVDPGSIKHFLRYFQVHYKKKKKKGPYRSSVKQALLEAKALQSLRKQVICTPENKINFDSSETMDVDNNTSENTHHESSWENSDELNGSNILTENYEPNLCSSRYSESPDYNLASSEENSNDPLNLDNSAVSDQHLKLGGAVDPDLEVLPEFRTSRIDLNPPSTRLPSFMEEFYPVPDCTENVQTVEETTAAEVPETDETTQISPIYFSDANSDVNKFPLASSYSENSTDVNSNPGEADIGPNVPQESPVAHYLETEGLQSTSTNREVCFPSPIIQTANQIGFSSLLIKEEQNESCEQEDQGFPVNSMFQEMVDVELSGVTTSVMQTSLLDQQSDGSMVNFIKEPNSESSHELIIKSSCHIKTPS